jgi:hypothetical protein
MHLAALLMRRAEMHWTVAGIVVLALGASPGAEAQRRTEADTRFASMDANDDGVVTRTEWQGSGRSFDVHDWNDDGVLSGDELRRDRRRPARRANEEAFETADREYEFTNWTEDGFRQLDHDRNGRLTLEEWHFDREGFRRADRNRDTVVSRAEFLGEGAGEDDDRGDRFAWLDANDDGRVSRAEWHGTAAVFDRLDDDPGRRHHARRMALVGRKLHLARRQSGWTSVPRRARGRPAGGPDGCVPCRIRPWHHRRAGGRA